MESDIENSPSASGQSETIVQQSYAVNIISASSGIKNEILELVPNITNSPVSPRILGNEGEALEKQTSEEDIESNRLKKEIEVWQKKFEEEVLKMERLIHKVVNLKENINPARKNADAGSDFKTNQMVKQLEKEKKKLQEYAESLEVELSDKDNEFKSLHEKLTEERKARLQQEHRSTSKRPPLPVARMPMQPRRASLAVGHTQGPIPKPMQPRRGSLAGGYTQGPISKPMYARRASLSMGHTQGLISKPPVMMPRRRVTIALRPEPGSLMMPRRGIRKYNLYSSMPAILTPAAGGKHPAGLSLQRKSLLWSPLMAKTCN